MFCLRPPGRLYGFIQTGGAAAYHHPLNPLNLLNPGAERRLNPQARQGLSSPYYTTNFPTKKEAAGAASFLYVISGQPDKP